ncbi:MAG: flagellar motor switch protein FliM [Thermodesulfobacteriota bacterium]|nr:flagellar motor switch protein FliM [Deltaproteobacteria bacterium]MDI6762829.1 flagellar motor switch protein FliM [Thermodesulfobacteriota bacterium]
MEKILCQEEIDALLRGMENGDVSTAPESPDRSGINRYDFNNQDRVIRGRMPTLEIINDHFCRLFRNSLSSDLRKTIDVGSRGNEMKKFGEFIKTLPVPSSLHVFRMDPLRGYAILAIEAKLVFTLLDVFFGGSGKGTYRVEGRDFTAIESRLIQKVATMIFSDMEKAWNVIHPITFQHVRSEINPQFVSIVPPSDLVINITFGVELEQFTGMITFCIPYANIEPIKNRLYSGFQSEQLEVDQTWVSRFLERLQSAEVEVKVELGKSKVMVQDLLRWKEGDVLSLNREVSDPLVVQVQGVPKFLGKPGICRGNKAIQIEGKVKSA